MRKKIITIIILLTALSFISLGLQLGQQNGLAGYLERMVYGA
jgi:hypothetical protein